MNPSDFSDPVTQSYVTATDHDKNGGGRRGSPLGFFILLAIFLGLLAYAHLTL